MISPTPIRSSRHPRRLVRKFQHRDFLRRQPRNPTRIRRHFELLRIHRILNLSQIQSVARQEVLGQKLLQGVLCADCTFFCVVVRRGLKRNRPGFVDPISFTQSGTPDASKLLG